MRIWVIHVTRNCLCERETLKVTNRENDRIQKGWNRQMMNIFLELPNMRVEEIFYSQYQGFNKKASCKKQPRIFSSLCSYPWHRELEAKLLILLYPLKLSAASTDGVRKPCSRGKEASVSRIEIDFAVWRGSATNWKMEESNWSDTCVGLIFENWTRYWFGSLESF